MDILSEKEMRLYDLLVKGNSNFCENIIWLGEDALSNDTDNRFEQMWTVYLSVMNRYGRKIFKGEVSLLQAPDILEEVFDSFRKNDYIQMISQLMYGAISLFEYVKTEGYEYRIFKLKEVVNQYCAMLRDYECIIGEGTTDYWIMFDFIRDVNWLYGTAYQIIQLSSKPETASIKNEQEEKEYYSQELLRLAPDWSELMGNR